MAGATLSPGRGLFVRDARLVTANRGVGPSLGVHIRGFYRSNPLIRQPAIFSYLVIVKGLYFLKSEATGRGGLTRLSTAYIVAEVWTWSSNSVTLSK